MSPDRGENKTGSPLNVFVNGRLFCLPRGMTVQHALIAAGVAIDPLGVTVTDEWGNPTGRDGALTEGMKLFTSKNGI
jgi:hypothetical protein